MSSLILPQNYTNPTLEKNLEVFFKRYPHEKARLEPVLRKSVPQQSLLGDLTVEAPLAKPPARILLMLGICNPVLIAELLNNEVLSRETFKFFVFENNPEFAAWAFQNADLTQVLSHWKTEWFICETVASVRPALFRALKPESVCSMMLNVQVYQREFPHPQEALTFYAKVPGLYTETAYHVLHNHGRVEDSMFGVDLTFKNRQFILSKPGILDLKDHYRGQSALIVGAGPSLDQEIQTIKKYNDRFVVIAADAALKPLLAAGIRVDYVTSIERHNIFQLPFFQGIDQKVDAELIAFPVVHPDVLSSYPGNVRLVYRNYSFFAYFEKAYPKGILRCGGSTSHLGVRLADYMGCRRVFLIGCDSAYEEKDGKFRSHCSGTGYPEWGEFLPLEDFKTVREHAPALTAYDNLGRVVTTNITYFQWAKEYSEELAVLGQRLSIKNTAKSGLAFDGVPYVDLAEAAEALSPMDIEKPAYPERAYFNRTWDHKELKANFEAYLGISRAILEEADALLKMDEIPLNRYQGLFLLYTGRLFTEDLFVAWVIQICARNFFELDNLWWAYDLDPTKDLRGKTESLFFKVKVFEDVLTKLLAIIEESKSE